MSSSSAFKYKQQFHGQFCFCKAAAACFSLLFQARWKTQSLTEPLQHLPDSHTKPPHLCVFAHNIRWFLMSSWNDIAPRSGGLSGIVMWRGKGCFCFPKCSINPQTSFNPTGKDRLTRLFPRFIGPVRSLTNPLEPTIDLLPGIHTAKEATLLADQSEDEGNILE